MEVGSSVKPMLGIAPMLFTRDMAGTIRFYTEVLGFQLNGCWPAEKPCWCNLNHGQANIMFNDHASYEASPPTMTGRLYLYTPDVMEIYHRVKDRAQVIEGPEVYFYKMKEIAILDNNGYVLAFGEDTDEAPTCHEEAGHE